MNVRALAAKAIFDVLEKGVSLSVALPEQQQHLEIAKQQQTVDQIYVSSLLFRSVA